MERKILIYFPIKAFRVRNQFRSSVTFGEFGKRFVVEVGCLKKCDFISIHFSTFQNFVRHDADLAKKYGKVFGFFEGTVPNLFISDADMIRAVFVKDFDHFVNRRVKKINCCYSIKFKW